MGRTKDYWVFSNLGILAYVTKRGNIKKQMKYNTYKAIIFWYAYNHTLDTYKLYHSETNRFIMKMNIKWVECKMIDPE